MEGLKMNKKNLNNERWIFFNGDEDELVKLIVKIINEDKKRGNKK
jgi:hypothetical protein